MLDGDVDLRTGVDLRVAGRLWIARDGHGALPVDLTVGGDPASVRADQIAAAINTGLGVSDFATVVDGRVRLTSQTTGSAAVITIEDGPGDAAELVLGLRARAYAGADAARAVVTGSPDLSTAVDLTADRYLRILVDGTRLAEVDCAAHAADPAAVDVGDITDAINDALGITVDEIRGRSGYQQLFKILKSGEVTALQHDLGTAPLVDVYKLEYFEVVCREDDETRAAFATFYLSHSDEHRVRVTDESAARQQRQPAEHPDHEEVDETADPKAAEAPPHHATTSSRTPPDTTS